jgi:hypothetical protein
MTGFRAVVLDGLGVDAHDVAPWCRDGAGVDQRFVDRLVGVLQLDVFAGHGDGHLVLGMDDALDEMLPILQRGRGRVAEADLVHHQAVDLVAAQVQRALVNRVGDIAEGDDVLALDVAEHGDLAAVVLVEVGSVRQMMMSGWMPISRSLATDCWVGLVFTSPAALM